MGSNASEIAELKRQIEKLEERTRRNVELMGRLAGFVKPGQAVWYYASPHHKHAAVVAGAPRELGSGEYVVALRDLDAAYVKETGRETVKAAATWALEPREVVETAFHPPPDAIIAQADSMDAVHEAHRVLLGRRATELLERMNNHGAKGITAAVDDIGELGRDAYRLVEDLAHPPETRDVCVIEELNEIGRRDTIDNWYKRRPKTVTELAEFVDELVLGYRHTYGSVIDAVCAAALAAAHTVNAAPQGRITGAQASLVPFIFIRHWQDKGDRPLAIRDFADMLYPQYADDFRTITLNTFQWLQRRARELLAEYDGVNDKAPAGAVEKHWRSIVDGEVPFGYRIKE